MGRSWTWPRRNRKLVLLTLREAARVLITLRTFIVPVSIGSPPVTYPLQLDLGSSDLLVASTLCGKNCPTSLGPTINPYYDASKQSAGFVAVNGNVTAWDTSFADGTTASGFIARDTVALGNTSIAGQVFGKLMGRILWAGLILR